MNYLKGKNQDLPFELFGKAGTELMPMLNGAEGSVEALKERANELGLVMSDEALMQEFCLAIQWMT